MMTPIVPGEEGGNCQGANQKYSQTAVKSGPWRWDQSEMLQFIIYIIVNESEQILTWQLVNILQTAIPIWVLKRAT